MLGTLYTLSEPLKKSYQVDDDIPSLLICSVFTGIRISSLESDGVLIPGSQFMSMILAESVVATPYFYSPCCVWLTKRLEEFDLSQKLFGGLLMISLVREGLIL